MPENYQIENKTEEYYCIWLKEEYPKLALALKLVLFAGAGFPDRTVLGHGHVFFIEFKREGVGRLLRPLQALWRKRLRRLGFKVYVCDTLKDAQDATFKEMGAA